MKNRTRLGRAGGFTLIELLLVLVILSVLAAVIVPKFTARSQDAKLTKAKTDIALLGGQLDIFDTDNGRYPATEEGLAALMEAPASLATTWKGPYIKLNSLNDPWGNAYIYRYPGIHNANGFDLSSLGPDGVESPDDLTDWSN